jgi:hypothetical protein
MGRLVGLALNEHERHIMETIRHTPVWVLAIFVVLLWLGWSARKDRLVPWRMPILVPLAMMGMAISGIVVRYQDTDLLLPSLLAWAAVTAGLGFYLLQKPLPPGFYYDAALHRFGMPASWWPLALYMGIFWVKFAVGVVSAVQPELAAELDFVLLVSAVYGVFSGVFLANVGRLQALRKSTLV